MEEKIAEDMAGKIEEVSENIKKKKKKIKEEKKELYNQFQKKGLMKKILLISLIPIIIMAVMLTVISSYKLIEVMREDAYSELEAVANMVDKVYDEIDDSNYVYEDGELKKGSYRITNNNAMIDAIKKKTGDDITVFYKNESILTTIFDKEMNRANHLFVKEDIENTVIKNGKVYKCRETIAGTEYCSVYIPLKDNSENVIGMLSASKEIKIVIDKMTEVVLIIGCSILALLVITIFAITYMVNGIIKRIKNVSGYLGNMRGGDLTTSIDKKVIDDKTEIGDIAESAIKLNFSLSEMIENMKNIVNNLSESSVKIKETVDITNSTTEEVDKAIEEIATGTVSQAEETQNATNDIIAMGQEIERISKSVMNLTNNSKIMKKNGEEAHKMVVELSVANAKTMSAVDRIYKHTELTNDAVLRISNAANAITAIAEETNLLALNASIEAARAGENGKGFAVVASEIQSLAEQTNVSADEIMNEINGLMSESEKSVEVMREVKTNVDMQSSKLANTKENFKVVIDGVMKSVESISEIESLMNELNENRKLIIDIIQSLSAISEENAAASEETSASTTQLSEVINDLSKDADSLNDLAQTLSREISVFKTV